MMVTRTSSTYTLRRKDLNPYVYTANVQQSQRNICHMLAIVYPKKGEHSQSLHTYKKMLKIENLHRLF